MRPWLHFVPYSYWFHDLPAVVRRLRANDSLAHSISRAGVQFAQHFISIDAAKEYTAALLNQYSRLLDHRVTRADVAAVECSEVRDGPMGCSLGWRRYNGSRIPFPDWLDPHRKKPTNHTANQQQRKQRRQSRATNDTKPADTKAAAADRTNEKKPVKRQK